MSYKLVEMDINGVWGIVLFDRLQFKYFREKKIQSLWKYVRFNVDKAITKIRKSKKNNSVGRFFCTGLVFKDIHEAIKN